ncbi:MAG: urea amidolyase associated protein UAAP1 [Pseudomonadota bacterium]
MNGLTNLSSATDEVAYADELPAGKHWSMLLRRGVAMRLTDVEGGANVGMLMFNPTNPLERLNLPDTLKCQHTFKLTAGHCLYSDMGRIFCSIIADDVGWHDAVGGTCNADLVASKWPAGSYQEQRNDYLRNGRDCFLIELAKYGLSKRDLAANVNWFSRIEVNDQGGMSLAASNSSAGASVTLRFEMDTLVALHTCPHPYTQADGYPRHPVRFALFEVPPPGPDDACRLACPENERGFRNNELMHLGGHW